MKNRRGFLCVSVAFVLLTCTVANAATYEIGSGGDWAAVIAAASPGDMIQVHAGAPVPSGVVVDKQLTITNYPSESPVLDAGGTASVAFSFPTAGNGSSISGLTFRGYTSYALTRYYASPTITVSGCVFDNCCWTLGTQVNASGCEIKNASKGGYEVSGSSFTNCTFTNISQNAIAWSSNLSFTGCTFTNVSSVTTGGTGLTLDTITVDGSVLAIDGTTNVTGTAVTMKNVTGGAFWSTSNLSLSNSTFQNVERAVYNASNVMLTNITQTGTGSYLVGWCDNVTIENASAENLGYFVGGDNVVVRNSTVKNMAYYGMAWCNNVTTENVTFDGGSMAYACCTGVNAVRNIIVNYKTGSGEAFYVSYGTVTNSTIVGNNVVRAWITDGSLDFDSCIVTGNQSFGWGGGTATYSLMQKDSVIMGLGEGNLIGYLPRFVDAANGNYALRANSPAIDMGNPTLDVPACGGTRVDMGAVEYDRIADAATPPTISIATPATSAVSPAFIEGTVSVDTTGVTWSAGGNSGNAVLTTAGKFWMNVPLSASSATSLTVTASDGTNNTQANQDITWDVTDILHPVESVVAIRKGDALLLTGTGTATELEIDANGDETLDLDGAAPGTTLSYTYTTAGSYHATATLKDAQGQVISTGTVYVTVVEANLHGPVASQIEYTRQLNVFTTPVDAKDKVYYISSDNELLSVSKGEYTEDGVMLSLTAHCRGTPVFEARLGGASGPILATQEIDEFTISTTAKYFIVTVAEDDEGGYVGWCKMTMDPLVPDLDIQLTINSAGITFDNGLSTMPLSSNELTLQGNGAGTYDYRVHYAPGMASICHGILVTQTHSATFPIGGGDSNNGEEVKITNGRSRLFLHETFDEEQDKQHNQTWSAVTSPLTLVSTEDKTLPPDLLYYVVASGAARGSLYDADEVTISQMDGEPVGKEFNSACEEVKPDLEVGTGFGTVSKVVMFNGMVSPDATGYVEVARLEADGAGDSEQDKFPDVVGVVQPKPSVVINGKEIKQPVIEIVSGGDGGLNTLGYTVNDTNKYTFRIPQEIVATYESDENAEISNLEYVWSFNAGGAAPPEVTLSTGRQDITVTVSMDVTPITDPPSDPQHIVMTAELHSIVVMGLKGTRLPGLPSLAPNPQGVPIGISLKGEGAVWANVRVKTSNDKARISLDGYTVREAVQNLPQYFSIGPGEQTIYLQGVTVSEVKDDVRIEVYGEQLIEQSSGDPTVDQRETPNGAEQAPYWTASYVGTDEEPFSVINIDFVREEPRGSGNYTAYNNLPIFQPDDGVGRGEMIVEDLYDELGFALPEFSDEVPTSILVNYHNTQYELNRQGIGSLVFRDATNIFELTFLDTPSPNGELEFYDLKYTSAGEHIYDKQVTVVETSPQTSIFILHGCKAKLAFGNPPTANPWVGLLSIDNGYMDDRYLTETPPQSGIFVSEDGEITVQVVWGTGFNDTSVDAVTVKVTSPVVGTENQLFLTETGLATNEFTNCIATFENGPDMGMLEVPDVAIWRVRVRGAHSNPKSTIGVTSDVETVAVGLIQIQTDLWVSDEIVLVPEGETMPEFQTLHTAVQSTEQPVIGAEYNPEAPEKAEPNPPAFLGKWYRDEISMRSDVKPLVDKMGYSAVADDSLHIDEALDAFPKNVLWVNFTHGQQKGYIYPGKQNERLWDTTPLLYTDFPSLPEDHEYEFVFLAGCESCVGSHGDAWRQKFKAKSMIGMAFNFNPDQVAAFLKDFLTKLGEIKEEDGKKKGATVKEAWQYAADRRPAKGPGVPLKEQDNWYRYGLDHIVNKNIPKEE